MNITRGLQQGYVQRFKVTALVKIFIVSLFGIYNFVKHSLPLYLCMTSLMLKPI